MSETWKQTIAGRLVEPVVVVGIGNSASGDDAAGPEVVRLLRHRTRAELLDCQMVPENFIGPITRARPRCVVLIDAVPAEHEPGAVHVYPLDAMQESSFHTHAASPSLFLRLVEGRTGASCFLVGIQPKTSGFGKPMSGEVAAAAAAVADAIAEILPPRA